MDASEARSSQPGGEPGTGPQRGAEDAPRLTPLRELQLLDAYKSGSHEALTDLLRAYQRRVYSICYRMLRDPDEAADLTQESLVRIMEGLESYDQRAAFSTWVIRVTMNCCFSHLRKQKLRRHGSLDEPGGADDDPWSARLPSDRELSADRHVEQAELSVVLGRALKDLDPQMRAILVLRDLQELDYQQIGDVLDVPIGTVKSRLFRARAALRAAAERELDQGGGLGATAG